MILVVYALAPEHSKQTKLGGGGGQAVDHKQCLPPPQTFVSSECSGATEDTVICSFHQKLWNYVLVFSV